MQVPRALRPALALSAFFLLIAPCPARAQQYTCHNLHTFAQWNDQDSRSDDASRPESSLVQGADGTFYGVTPDGGTNGTGAIYSLKNGVATILYNFEAKDSNGKNTYGASPTTSLVIGSDGSLYGATMFGGASGAGAIYRLKGGLISRIHTFPTEGIGDIYLTIGPGDVLYGVDENGGAHSGGQIFSVYNGVFTDLYDFPDGNIQGNAPNGASPNAAPTLAADGTLYGTTSGGGTGAGAIYKFANGTLTALHVFNVPDSHGNPVDGSFPYTKLILGTDGTLYGTTDSGINPDTDYGTLFSLKDGVLTTLHVFTGPDGYMPDSNLVLGPDGTLYGATLFGGAHGNGAVYSWKAGIFRSLYSCDAFTTQSHEINANGVNPEGITLGSDGSLYVCASVGGANGNGTLFSLTSTSWTVRSIAAGANGETRLLWTQPSGAASIWTVPASGAISYSATYGPYADWAPRNIALGASGATDIWWSDSTGGASYWQVGPTGALWQSPVYDPAGSWTAVDFSASADGSVRILWTKTSGEASIWTIGANHAISYNPIYGPYAGWSAEHIAAGPSGSSRILWTTAEGAASVWTIPASGAASYSATYGPYAGWACANIGLAADGATRLQWNSGASTSYWTVPSSGHNTYSQIWGPYDPWNPGDFSVADDGSLRLLWSTPAGLESYWTVGTGGGVSQSPAYGPY